MAVESTMFGSFGSTAISDISNRRHSHWLPFRLLLAFSIKGVLVEVLSGSSGGFMP